MGVFDKIKEGLAKTKKAMADTLDAIFVGGELDDEFFEELTDCLILADLGVSTATKAVEKLRGYAEYKGLQTTEEAKAYLKLILADMLYVDVTALKMDTKPSVVLVIGVNGVGKTITLLSGGEKAFVAIALYFAILKVRPTPFCMLDEIAAALDDRNVERYANYLHNLSQKTQFNVITHRRGTMEAADVLYGVTIQQQGVSKLLRLDLNQMEEYLGITE